MLTPLGTSVILFITALLYDFVIGQGLPLGFVMGVIVAILFKRREGIIPEIGDAVRMSLAAVIMVFVGYMIVMGAIIGHIMVTGPELAPEDYAIQSAAMLGLKALDGAVYLAPWVLVFCMGAASGAMLMKASSGQA